MGLKKVLRMCCCWCCEDEDDPDIEVKVRCTSYCCGGLSQQVNADNESDKESAADCGHEKANEGDILRPKTPRRSRVRSKVGRRRKRASKSRTVVAAKSRYIHATSSST